MLKNMKVWMKLLLGFGTVSLLLVATCVYSIHDITLTSYSTNAVYNQSYMTTKGLLTVLNEFSKMRLNLKEAATVHDNSKLSQYMSDVSDGESRILSLLDTMINQELMHTDFIKKLKSDFLSWKIIRSEINQTIMSEKEEEAFAIMNGKEKQFISMIEEELQKNISAVEKEVQTRIAVTSAQFQSTTRYVYAALGITLLLAIGVFLFVIRSICGPLERIKTYSQAVSNGHFDEQLALNQQDEVGIVGTALQTMVSHLKSKIVLAQEKEDQAKKESSAAQSFLQEAEVARSAAEQSQQALSDTGSQIQEVLCVVRAAVQDLLIQIEQAHRGADVQADRVGETAMAMKEMNIAVLHVAQNAANSSQAASSGRHCAQDGAELMGGVVSEMRMIQEHAEELKTDIAELGENAKSIGSIMNVISDIADQTNLLALNAAIEAARAGDAGRGFAVVADEVRKLAEKTMIATKEVGDAISGIQRRTQRNVVNVDQSVRSIKVATDKARHAGEAINQIVTMIDDAAEQAQSIAASSEEQSMTSDSINNAITDIYNISKQTVDEMNQAAQFVTTVIEQAQILSGLVEKLESNPKVVCSVGLSMRDLPRRVRPSLAA